MAGWAQNPDLILKMVGKGHRRVLPGEKNLVPQTEMGMVTKWHRQALQSWETEREGVTQGHTAEPRWSLNYKPRSPDFQRCP